MCGVHGIGWDRGEAFEVSLYSALQGDTWVGIPGLLLLRKGDNVKDVGDRRNGDGSLVEYEEGIKAFRSCSWLFS